MISLAFKRIVQAKKLQLVPGPKFLCRHEPSSMFSSLAAQTNPPHASIQSTRFLEMNFVARRTIYDASLLEIASLEAHQEKTSHLLEKDKEACISRIQKYIKTGDTACLLLDDMINLIGLAENEQHLDLIEEFIKLMKDQVDLVGWSAAVMRLYYKMNQVDRAFNNTMDTEKFGSVFHSHTSFRIACTLLYNAGRHEDVLKLYSRAKETLKTRETRINVLNPGRHPGLAIIAVASLAKSDLPHALSEAEKIYSSLGFGISHNYIQIRMKALLSYIAIKSNQYAAALNMIAATPGKNYVSLRELKTLALIRLNRFEDIPNHIKNSIQLAHGKGVILSDHYDLIEEKLGEIENKTLQDEITELLIEIKKDHSLITHATIEDMLFAEISKPKSTDQGSQSDTSNFRRDTNHDSLNSRSKYDRKRPYNKRGNSYQPKSYLDEAKMEFKY